MKPTRLVWLTAALAVVATACAGAVAGDEGDTSDSTLGSADRDDTVASAELVSPTETDRPLDLTGGTMSTDEGVIAESNGPGAPLNVDVAQAVAPWETDWTRRTVGLDEFLLGINTVDPRDRIRPIDTPRFEPIADAAWLDPREPGALVQQDGDVRFYPLSILTRHEIVNDRFGDVPVAITYCPLCNTALAFDTRVDGQALRFGVSGLLRNSDLVMWDDATTSLWQQITGEAVVGELAGTQLEIVPTSIVAYADARDNFPEALSLSQETGFGIDYGRNPYEAYSSSERPFLFDGEPDPRFPALSRVVGVSVDGDDKAFPFEIISVERAVNDQVGDTPVVVLWGGETADALDSSTIADGAAIGSGIAYDPRVDDQLLTFSPSGGGDDGGATAADLFVDAETGSTWNLLGRAVDGPLRGEQLAIAPHRNEFWFAWASFFPDAEVYEAS